MGFFSFCFLISKPVRSVPKKGGTARTGLIPNLAGIPSNRLLPVFFNKFGWLVKKKLATLVMTANKNLLLRNKATIIYSVSLALLLFLLKWLELRFIIFHHSYEIYIGFIAVIFTALRGCPG